MTPVAAEILTALSALVAMGVVLGLIIGLTVRYFGVETDPRIEQVDALLPGANCGACGYAGCAAFAKAVVAGEADPGQCPSSDDETVNRICALLGRTPAGREARIAVVRCGGDREHARRAAAYNGVSDCRDAMLVAGGAKGCLHGCLGLGTCARVCPFGAIEITTAGLAVVHPDICTGCGKCVAACPRDLIVLVPKNAPLHVLCNSPEKGAAKRKVCDVACIACRKCVKAAEPDQMQMDGFLARVNYEDPPGPELAEVCPTGCLQPALTAATAEQDEPREVANA